MATDLKFFFKNMLTDGCDIVKKEKKKGGGHLFQIRVSIKRTF